MDEHVILGLGLDLDVELLEPQVDSSRDHLDERAFEVQARVRHAGELAEPLHDRGRLPG